MAWLLVVEDEEDIRELVTEVLREDGHDVEAAANGREALDIIARRGADLPLAIILDLMMPVMSGWDFLAERRRIGQDLLKVPVLILTADPLQATSYARDALVVIGKPFNITTLLHAVRAIQRVHRRLGTTG